MEQILIDYRGKEIVDGETKCTLKDVSCKALSAVIPQDRELDWKQKFKLGELARDIWNGKIQLSSEEITLLKERIGLCFSQIVVEPACKALELQE